VFYCFGHALKETSSSDTDGVSMMKLLQSSLGVFNSKQDDTAVVLHCVVQGLRNSKDSKHPIHNRTLTEESAEQQIVIKKEKKQWMRIARSRVRRR
jgi:hypothetical protein